MRKVGHVGRFPLYWASRKRFKYEGLHIWTGRRHVRLIPLNRFRAWIGHDS
jgi:hypothetical protein